LKKILQIGRPRKLLGAGTERKKGDILIGEERGSQVIRSDSEIYGSQGTIKVRGGNQLYLNSATKTRRKKQHTYYGRRKGYRIDRGLGDVER